MNSLVLNATLEHELLAAGFVDETATLFGSMEWGVDNAAFADREGFFCVTLVQSLMVRGPLPQRDRSWATVLLHSGQIGPSIRFGKRLEGGANLRSFLL